MYGSSSALNTFVWYENIKVYACVEICISSSVLYKRSTSGPYSLFKSGVKYMLFTDFERDRMISFSFREIAVHTDCTVMHVGLILQPRNDRVLLTDFFVRWISFYIYLHLIHRSRVRDSPSPSINPTVQGWLYVIN